MIGYNKLFVSFYQETKRKLKIPVNNMTLYSLENLLTIECHIICVLKIKDGLFFNH